MSARMESIAFIFWQNEWIFAHAVKEVTAEGASYRVHPDTNSFARIAGHLVVSRHSMLRLLGTDPAELPWGDFARADRTSQFRDEIPCPPLDEIVLLWREIAPGLREALLAAPEEVLARRSPMPIPTPEGEPTVADLGAFLAMHESYHLGQLGLLKRALGGPPIMGPRPRKES